jgi:hypothetical protein
MVFVEENEQRKRSYHIATIERNKILQDYLKAKADFEKNKDKFELNTAKTIKVLMSL